MNLSKSRYTKAIQCPKMLWMDQHLPQYFDQGVLNQSVLDNGSLLGDMAMAYYGDFVEVAFSEGSKQPMIDDTARLLQEAQEGRGPANIAEASFSYDGNFCSVDILRVEDDGVHLVEVKSSTHVRDLYKHDMAFQCWVLQHCGLKVKSVSLMHVNSAYVRQGELDIAQLFVPEDFTEEVFSMLDQVERNVPLFKATADGEEEPATPLGCQCKSPYECGYRSWCWRHIPAGSVFELAGITGKKAFALYDQGVCTMSDALHASGVKLNPRQSVQAKCADEGLDFLVDKPQIAAFLDTLEYPLYFLDFETFQPAAPLYDGTRPYAQIPTQYSLHVLRSPDAPLEHFDFLAPSVGDPRRSVAENLVADIPAGSCVIAYNMSFEKNRIKEMAEAFPDLAEHLMSLHQGMRDLLVPFQKGACYFTAMGGSNSIKAVLPALFPHDPQLDYHALEGVHNGAEASSAFAQLATMDPEQEDKTRSDLLKYCELDTLAMVKIWQKLIQLAAED
ncbi:MAG: DUF2779 domain-containing protein [Eggerthellales bacterium]|nr:DUF2779 domain-containing protein [Eggerthellales bacterium]